MNTANANGGVDEFQQALTQLRHSVAIAEEVQAAHPGMPDLAGTCSQYLGFAREGMGHLTGDPKYFKEAVAAHRRCAVSACRLAERLPDPQKARNCADGMSELSWALRNDHQGELAVEAARDAIARMEPIAKAEPASNEAQQDLAIAYFHLGAADNAAGRFRDAISDLRTAEARLRPSRQVPAGDPLETIKVHLDIQRELATSLLGLHQNAAAAEALQQALSLAAGRSNLPAWDVAALRRQLDKLQDTIHDRGSLAASNK